MNGWVVALRLTGLGWYVGTCIVGGIAGGLGLDKLIGTSPVFTLVGLGLGIVLAFWGLFKLIQPILYGSKREDMTRGRKR